MLHQLTVKTRNKKRVGRGGSRGKNAGRGNKGQKSRAGRKIKPVIRDELQRIPKRRGHNKNRARGVRFRLPTRTLTFEIISRNFKKNEKVSPFTLISKRIFTKSSGKYPNIKLVSKGELKHPVVISKINLSEKAKEEILRVGGKII